MKLSAITPDARLPFVAYATKGLSHVVRDELSAFLPRATIDVPAERFVLGECSPKDLERAQATLRTVDDLRVLVAGPTEIRTEEAFIELCAEAHRRAAELISGTDRVHVNPWSITLSARNPAWRGTKGWNPGPIVARHLRHADIQGTTRSAVDLRLQVDRTMMHVALNVWPRPLGKRDEPAPVRMGALRPTVAAAMVRIALSATEPAIHFKGVYDPFAGTGTIVVEAAWLGLTACASDIDPEALVVTRRRLAKLTGTNVNDDGLRQRVFGHDVLLGFPARVGARLVVGNLPWGKQVRIERRQELFEGVAAIAAHAASEGGVAVLLTANEDYLHARVRRVDSRLRITARRIGLLGQTPAIVVVGGP